MYTQNYKFITAKSEIIRSQEVDIVYFPLQTDITITLLNVAYTPKCDSNLISLDQLRESGILYYDHSNSMILKQRESILGVASRKKNLFVFETGCTKRAMLIQGRGQLIYYLSINPKIRLWDHRFRHTSNARVVQAFKLVNKIDFGEATSFNESHFSDFKPENKNSDNKLTIINKVTENDLKCIEQLCEACIKCKYTRIVKSKKMTPTTRVLQKVYVDLWGLHKPIFISENNYMDLLFDKFTQKSWIFLLRSKDKFFDTFKLWLLRVKVSGSRLDYLWSDGEGEFISTIF